MKGSELVVSEGPSLTSLLKCEDLAGGPCHAQPQSWSSSQENGHHRRGISTHFPSSCVAEMMCGEDVSSA